MIALGILMLLCAGVPAALFLRNLSLYLEPPQPNGTPEVSILIPARNEAHGIGDAVRSALASSHAAVEVIVMDDHSADATASIVRQMAAEDPRVRLEQAPALPPGWNGKQHACWALAHAARSPVLCFVDADVRLGPDCVARMASLLAESDNALVSGFPRQITGTFLEWILLPLIHFVLLGFLPLSIMRRGTEPGFAAGCGQFLMVRRDPYFASGGHSGIQLTMHDGLRLPRLFREHGFRTDLADLTNLATCRMYTSAAQVWNGLAKNATEGIAAPPRIVPVTLILLLGQVLPFFASVALLLLACFTGVVLAGCLTCSSRSLHLSGGDWALFLLCVSALVASYLPRCLGVSRFRQDWRSALLHPLGIMLLLAIQWYALIRKLAGRSVSWRDRAYSET